MIQFEEFQFLVENAISLFKKQRQRKNYYEDIAWDYARGVLKNVLDENRKRDLFFRLIDKLNEKYQEKYQNQIILQQVIPNSKEGAILSFLMDWNHRRFTSKKDSKELINYMNGTLQAIQTILQSIDDIRNKSSKEAFKKVEKTINLGEHEYVSAAKILMLINPNRFIAWDRQIVERFALSPSNYEHYGIFNALINNFINRNNAIIKCIENYAKDYMRANNYIDNDSYKIRKLLDMIFWITYNRKNVSMSDQVYCYTEKLVNSILCLY